MARTETFRRQHIELLAIAGEMTAILDAEALKKDASAMRRLLSSLAGKLTVHLAMEDNGLYPRLLAHKDAKISATARSYVDEMGGIKTVFVAYLEKWPNEGAIRANPAVFIKETQAIFQALATRIAREDQELYDLVDRVG